MYKTVSFSRQDLFDKVWTAPLLQLARDIGVSDVALGKACRRARIPLPGRGYWAKPAESRGKPPLPKSHDPYYDTVSFSVLDPEFKPKPIRVPVDAEPVLVPDQLTEPHPLIAKTLKLASGADTVEGRLSLDFKQALHVRISPDALDRTLRVLDALIKASEKKGCAWRVTKEGATIVTFAGEDMKVDVKERLVKREVPPPPPPERRPGRRWEPNYAAIHYPRHEWVSTNQLSFQIDEYVEGTVRRNWNDAKRTLLEDKLHEIVAGFPAVAAGIKQRREQLEARQRERELEEERRLERAREAEKLRRLRSRLVVAMSQWEQASRLRRFCDAVETRMASLPEEQAESTMRWLEWARQQADGLDPLLTRLDALGSLDVQLPSWFKGMGGYDQPAADWWTAKNPDM